jgi:hypothetical protein
MKYMCLLYGEIGARPAPGTAEFRGMLEEFGVARQLDGTTFPPV